jgi:hypothetical protein
MSTPVKHPDAGGAWVRDPKSGALHPASCPKARSIIDNAHKREERPLHSVTDKE